jgi:hypothetical protein
MATGAISRLEATDAHLAEERRRYKREYMRRWRADPLHRGRERANRERSQYKRKLRKAARRGPACGFCHQRRPKWKVVRLRPIAQGFVKVVVPYCGQC